MSRSSRRASRRLFALFALAGGLFAVFYFWQPGKTDAEVPGVQPREEASAVAATPTNSAASAAPSASAAKPAPTGVAPTTRPAPRVEVPTVKATFLADAERLVAAGELLEARQVLNDAIQSDQLDDASLTAAKAQASAINQTVIFSPQRFDADPFQGSYTIQSGDNLGAIARPLLVPYQTLARVNGIAPNRIRAGQAIKTIQGPFFAEVSKSKFTLDLYLGGLPGEPDSMYVTTFHVGLGENSSTPTGVWLVTPGSKLVNPEWTNPRTNEVMKADDPENPLGERWIGLTGVAGDAVGKPSYGIHGTIFPETIGTNASMGCIRLVNDDVAVVYDLLLEGKSTVRVVD